MALIKRQEKASFKKVKVELNEELLTLLNLYAEMIEATPDYVIGEALKMVFSKDKDFLNFIKEQGLKTTQKDIENLIVSKPEVKGRG